MINIYLLTKIAGTDMEFRRRIIQMISSKASKFRIKFESMARIHNWNACYYTLLDFYNQVTPYSSVNFLNELQKAIEILSESNDPKLKEIISQALIRKIEDQRHEADKRLRIDAKELECG